MNKYDSVIHFTRGAPADSMLATDLIIQGSSAALQQFHAAALRYGSAYGFPPLREWIATREGVPIEEVIVGNGSINVLAFLVEYLLKPGDVVFVEEPSYDRALSLFRRAGARVRAIPLEEDGISLSHLRQALRETPPRLFYLITEFNNPAGTRTSLVKREALAAEAREHDFLLVDDRAYQALRYSGPALPRLHDLAPEHSIMLGSFSKLLAPGLRTGWAILPARLAQLVAAYIEDALISPNYFAEATIAAIVSTPAYDDTIANLCQAYGQLRDQAEALITVHLEPLGVRWIRPDGGFFIGLWLPETARPAWHLGPTYGLDLLNGDAFFLDRKNTNFVRLPFCSVSSAELHEGIARLAALLRDFAGE